MLLEPSCQCLFLFPEEIWRGLGFFLFVYYCTFYLIYPNMLVLLSRGFAKLLNWFQFTWFGTNWVSFKVLGSFKLSMTKVTLASFVKLWELQCDFFWCGFPRVHPTEKYLDELPQVLLLKWNHEMHSWKFCDYEGVLLSFKEELCKLS